MKYRELFQEGKKFFMKGLSADPGIGERDMANAALRFTEAIEEFEKQTPKGILHKAIYAAPHLYRGFIYYQVGKKKETIEDLKKVIEAIELSEP